MSHLSTDRLAAIADDTPTPDEATHLAGCWDCRAEVAAYRRLARMAAMAPIPSEPLTAWSQLAPQLRADGLIVDASRVASGGSGASVQPLMRNGRKPTLQLWTMRLAAGLALLVGGGLVGRVTADGPEALPFEASLVASQAQPVAQFRSPDEAIRALTVAQQQYQVAAAFLASQDTLSRFVGMNQDSYEARLAALDEIAATTRAALYRAPQDPLLNQYYLTTLGAREATLREIGASLPGTRRLERY
ncbi:MAG: hypothetical protein KF689_00540 [Gemmatimonadaceae bacterium]|nr:hypothetical protein [Gemmatimonadaceae bacterium]MCW5826415.1 hypothetical protein [Gemmatimonadaceae bacterium]